MLAECDEFCINVRTGIVFSGTLALVALTASSSPLGMASFIFVPLATKIYREIESWRAEKNINELAIKILKETEKETENDNSYLVTQAMDHLINQPSLLISCRDNGILESQHIKQLIKHSLGVYTTETLNTAKTLLALAPKTKLIKCFERKPIVAELAVAEGFIVPQDVNRSIDLRNFPYHPNLIRSLKEKKFNLKEEITVGNSITIFCPHDLIELYRAVRWGVSYSISDDVDKSDYVHIFHELSCISEEESVEGTRKRHLPFSVNPLIDLDSMSVSVFSVLKRIALVTAPILAAITATLIQVPVLWPLITPIAFMPSYHYFIAWYKASQEIHAIAPNYLKSVDSVSAFTSETNDHVYMYFFTDEYALDSLIKSYLENVQQQFSLELFDLLCFIDYRSMEDKDHIEVFKKSVTKILNAFLAKDLITAPEMAILLGSIHRKEFAECFSTLFKSEEYKSKNFQFKDASIYCTYKEIADVFKNNGLDKALMTSSYSDEVTERNYSDVD
jgi:hypothetical protein